MSKSISTSNVYRVQNFDTGQFITGQFILEGYDELRTVRVAKFVAEINFEMTYFDVEGETTFESVNHFFVHLNANENDEVIGKATFQTGFNCTGKLTLF